MYESLYLSKWTSNILSGLNSKTRKVATGMGLTLDKKGKCLQNKKKLKPPKMFHTCLFGLDFNSSFKAAEKGLLWFIPLNNWHYFFLKRTEFALRAWKIKIINFLEKNTTFFPLGYLLRVGTEMREKEREQERIKQSQISDPSNNSITLPLKSFIITEVTPSSSEWFVLITLIY